MVDALRLLASDIMNPADGELLDVMLVDGGRRERAERLHVRVIDVLERSDGDHKLLALAGVGAPPAEQRLVADAEHADLAAGTCCRRSR